MQADQRTSEQYEETVGSTAIGPYAATGALLVACPNCQAPEGIRCAAPESVTRIIGPRKRRIPCLKRIKAAEVRQ